MNIDSTALDMGKKEENLKNILCSYEGVKMERGKSIFFK